MRDIIFNAIWAIIIGGWIAIIGACLWFITSSPEPIKADYAIHFNVPRPNEIEAAVSNAVLDLCKQDFVPIAMHVEWVPFKNAIQSRDKGNHKGQSYKLQTIKKETNESNTNHTRSNRWHWSNGSLHGHVQQEFRNQPGGAGEHCEIRH